MYFAGFFGTETSGVLIRAPLPLTPLMLKVASFTGESPNGPTHSVPADRIIHRERGPREGIWIVVKTCRTSVVGQFE